MINERISLLGSRAVRNRKKTFLRYLSAHRGVVTNAAKSARISRPTYYAWLDKDPMFRRLVDEIKEETIDFVEDKMFNLIEKESEGMIKYYLSRIAKDRGYIETSKKEITGAEGKPIEIDYLDLSKLPTEVLLKIEELVTDTTEQPED